MAKQTTKQWYNELAELPVCRFLSQASWIALRVHVQNGQKIQRSYRLIEFFRALDWLPVEEIEPNPLKLLPPRDEQRILQEIAAYFSDKQSKRSERRQQREAYKLKVFEYFRTHVSPEDKALLEQLRDFELEKIGQDVNWRHYFWFTSFKQIDMFNNQTPLVRQAKINQFKLDVIQHFNNAQRLRDGSYAQYYWGSGFEGAGETFDDWLNRQPADFHQKHRQQQQQQQQRRQRRYRHYSMPESPLVEAYRQLEMTSAASFTEVRQQFRRLALQYHPDRPGGSEERMKQIIAAYDTLKKTLSPQ